MMTEVFPMQTVPSLDSVWPESRYPDGTYFETLSLSDYETEFFSGEYGRGLTYYLSRLDRLQFSGGRVLDAGCGVGQWSLALSRRFSQVDAIDINEERLQSFKRVLEHTGTANVHIQPGSIASIPFPNETFDAVFCYGVIMFTDIRKSLSEFERVLRPGGRVYICLNADGWYQMLQDSRDDNGTRRYMRHILAKSYLERNGIELPDAALCRLTYAARKELGKVTGRFGKSFWKEYAKLPFGERFLCKAILSKPNLTQLLEPYIRRVGPVGYRHFASYLLQELPKTSRSCFDDLFSRCVRAFQLHPHMVLEEKQSKLQSYFADLDDERLSDPTRAYQPEEFGLLVEHAGFCHYQFSTEAGLVFDSAIPQPLPMYEGHYKTQFCVWETCFSKPRIQPDLMTPELHMEEAARVRKQRYFVSQATPCHVSIASQDAYPEAWLQLAVQRARRVGGRQHLTYLAEALCRDKHTDEDRFKAILGFIQKAIIRDPISQPLIQGLLPKDPTVTLMSHLGRCGHVANLAVAMLGLVGIPAEVIQLPRHVSAKALVDGQWVLAEADIYKNGIFPVNAQGKLLSIDEINKNPYWLDRFQPSGWFAQPGTVFTRDCWGNEVLGYIDALPFEKRGFISGYFHPDAVGYPPSLPEITNFTRQGNLFSLSWKPSHSPENDFLLYRVSVGTVSRQWRYDAPGSNDEILSSTADDVLSLETMDTQVSGAVPCGTSLLFASVTAVSRRIEKEPGTFFWPSEEAVCGFVNNNVYQALELPHDSGV